MHIASNVVWVLRADRWARRVQMYPTEAGYCWLPKLSSFTSVIAWDCREKLVWDGIVAGFIIYVSLIVRCHRSARAGISLTTVVRGYAGFNVVLFVQIPVQLSFGGMSFTDPLDVASDLVFMCDVWINFRTSTCPSAAHRCSTRVVAACHSPTHACYYTRDNQL